MDLVQAGADRLDVRGKQRLASHVPFDDLIAAGSVRDEDVTFRVGGDAPAVGTTDDGRGQARTERNRCIRRKRDFGQIDFGRGGASVRAGAACDQHAAVGEPRGRVTGTRSRQRAVDMPSAHGGVEEFRRRLKRPRCGVSANHQRSSIRQCGDRGERSRDLRFSGRPPRLRWIENRRPRRLGWVIGFGLGRAADDQDVSIWNERRAVKGSRRAHACRLGPCIGRWIEQRGRVDALTADAAAGNENQSIAKRGGDRAPADDDWRIAAQRPGVRRRIVDFRGCRWMTRRQRGDAASDEHAAVAEACRRMIDSGGEIGGGG